MRPYIVWPWVSGLVLLLAGLLVARKSLHAARGLEKLAILGPVFVAAPLAAFGAEHLTIGQFVMQAIPAWMPARPFFVYFVGVALFAAAASLAARRCVRQSASLLALMFVIFVVTMHVPNAVETGDRFAWTVALRDLSFGGGAMSLAAAYGVGRRARGTSWLGAAGRLIVGTACVVFGVLHFLHPLNAPGVPLRKMTPPWIPLPALWAYLTGATEIVAGALMVADRRTRAAAQIAGLLVVVLVVAIYLPFVPAAVEGGEKLEALNYVWDTLLFAGTVLLVGATRPEV
jgi:uncharacterized membrane protein